MVKLSSEFTGESTLHMDFQELSFQDSFDGIWACASLLHISSIGIESVLSKLLSSLKSQGILYLSLKIHDREKHDREKVIEGRLFSFYSEESIQIC
jgi:hypothetical protein